jgi:O-antigen ligase
MKKELSGQVPAVFLFAALALAVVVLPFLHLASFENSVVIVIALLVFILAFLKTDFALCILIFSMLFSPEIGAGGGVIGRSVVVRAEDLFLVVIFFGWFAKMAVNKELGLVRVNPLNRPIAVYIFACVLSSLLGVWRGGLQFKSSVFYVFKYIEYFLIFFMVADNLKNERQARFFVSMILLAGFLVCLFGLSQIPGGERVTAPFEGNEGGEPNTFAGYLLILQALILGFLLHSPSPRRKLLMAGFLVIAFVVFVFTLSRGGWLGFIPMILTVIAFNRRHRLTLILTLGVAALLVPFFLPQKVHQRLQDTFVQDRSYHVMGVNISLSESAGERIDAWKVGWREWKQRPFLGFGIPGGNVIDNQYMRVLTETGTFGLAAFFWLIGTVFVVCVRVYRTMDDDPFARAVSMGLAAGLAGILLQSLSSADFILIRVMEPFWFLAAIVVMLPTLKESHE